MFQIKHACPEIGPCKIFQLRKKNSPHPLQNIPTWQQRRGADKIVCGYGSPPRKETSRGSWKPRIDMVVSRNGKNMVVSCEDFPFKQSFLEHNHHSI